MFVQQYFDHVAPGGKGPSDLMDDIGYEYIMVAENLALGNYIDDIVLVQAWMDSPGHWANILDNKVIEMGVAVVRGVIDNLQVQVNNLKIKIESKRQIIESSKPFGSISQEQVDPYNIIVAEYNETTREYNEFLDRLKVAQLIHIM